MFDGPACSLFDFFDSWNLIPLVDKAGRERFKSLGLRLGRHETGKLSLMTHYPVYRGHCWYCCVFLRTTPIHQPTYTMRWDRSLLAQLTFCHPVTTFERLSTSHLKHQFCENMVSAQSSPNSISNKGRAGRSGKQWAADVLPGRSRNS